MRIGSVSLSLLLAVVLALAGNGLLSTLAAVRLADAGVSQAVAGWILASYFAGLTAGTLFLTSTVARVGHIRAFSAFIALGVAAALAHGLFPPGWGWAPLRAVTGLSMAGVYITVESWLNGEASPATRGRILAAYLVALYLGTGMGQLALPHWPPAGAEAFAVAALLTSLAAIPISLTRVSAPALGVAPRMGLAELVRAAPIGWVGAGVSGFVAGTVYASIPVAARESGLDAAALSTLMAALVFGGLAGQWPIGALSDWVDRRAVLLIVVVMAGGLCAVLGSTPGASPLPFPVAELAFGALVFAIYPLAVAHAHDRLGPERAVPAAAQLLLASSCGAIAGPAVVSLAAPILGPAAVYTVDALVLVGFGAGVLWRLVRFDRAPQAAYRAMPRTSFVVNELDPRLDRRASESRAPRRGGPGSAAPTVGGPT